MILPLEQQCCSLESAKRLKELGVKQESLFWYVEGPEDGDKPWILQGAEAEPAAYICSAFTCSELGELLPIDYESGKVPKSQIHIGKYYAHAKKCQKFGNTEADARAQLLIFLISNGLSEGK